MPQSASRRRAEAALRRAAKAEGLAHSKTSRPIGARDASRFTAPTPQPLPNSRHATPRHARSGLKSALLALLLPATLLPQLSACLAQSFAIDWHTLDGGGGTSTGGGFSLQGTIGQPEAGVLAGGGFTVTGGFPGFHLVPAGPVTLTIQLLASGQVQVSWPADGSGWVLEAATSLWPASVWQTVASPLATSYSTPALGPAGYFRLRRP